MIQEEKKMAITAAQVKELREMTGAGMMDCKKALTATEGDMDKAVEFLREKGLATAQKKASRVAAEGLCKALVAEDGKNAVVVEVNAETDFVAKNEKFQNYVADVAAQALTTGAADIDAFLAEPWALDPEAEVLPWGPAMGTRAGGAHWEQHWVPPGAQRHLARPAG